MGNYDILWLVIFICKCNVLCVTSRAVYQPCRYSDYWHYIAKGKHSVIPWVPDKMAIKTKWLQTTVSNPFSFDKRNFYKSEICCQATIGNKPLLARKGLCAGQVPKQYLNEWRLSWPTHICVIRHRWGNLALYIISVDLLSKRTQRAMMTSSNGNIFRVTGHLYGKFTGPRWISRTKASDAELWCLLWSASE